MVESMTTGTSTDVAAKDLQAWRDAVKALGAHALTITVDDDGDSPRIDELKSLRQNERAAWQQYRKHWAEGDPE